MHKILSKSLLPHEVPELMREKSADGLDSTLLVDCVHDWSSLKVTGQVNDLEYHQFMAKIASSKEELEEITKLLSFAGIDAAVTQTMERKGYDKDTFERKFYEVLATYKSALEQPASQFVKNRILRDSFRGFHVPGTKKRPVMNLNPDCIYEDYQDKVEDYYRELISDDEEMEAYYFDIVQAEEEFLTQAVMQIALLAIIINQELPVEDCVFLPHYQKFIMTDLANLLWSVDNKQKSIITSDQIKKMDQNLRRIMGHNTMFKPQQDKCLQDAISAYFEETRSQNVGFTDIARLAAELPVSPSLPTAYKFSLLPDLVATLTNNENFVLKRVKNMEQNVHAFAALLENTATETFEMRKKAFERTNLGIKNREPHARMASFIYSDYGLRSYELPPLMPKLAELLCRLLWKYPPETKHRSFDVFLRTVSGYPHIAATLNSKAKEEVSFLMAVFKNVPVRRLDFLKAFDIANRRRIAFFMQLFDNVTGYSWLMSIRPAENRNYCQLEPRDVSLDMLMLNIYWCYRESKKPLLINADLIEDRTREVVAAAKMRRDDIMHRSLLVYLEKSYKLIEFIINEEDLQVFDMYGSVPFENVFYTEKDEDDEDDEDEITTDLIMP